MTCRQSHAHLTLAHTRTATQPARVRSYARRVFSEAGRPRDSLPQRCTRRGLSTAPRYARPVISAGHPRLLAARAPGVACDGGLSTGARARISVARRGVCLQHRTCALACMRGGSVYRTPRRLGFKAQRHAHRLDQRPQVLVVNGALHLGESATVAAKDHRLVLQVAFAALIADGAVQRVVDLHSKAQHSGRGSASDRAAPARPEDRDPRAAHWPKRGVATDTPATPALAGEPPARARRLH
jgi:hypothetical protein